MSGLRTFLWHKIRVLPLWAMGSIPGNVIAHRVSLPAGKS